MKKLLCSPGPNKVRPAGKGKLLAVFGACSDPLRSRSSVLWSRTWGCKGPHFTSHPTQLTAMKSFRKAGAVKVCALPGPDHPRLRGQQAGLRQCALVWTHFGHPSSTPLTRTLGADPQLLIPQDSPLVAQSSRGEVLHSSPASAWICPAEQPPPGKALLRLLLGRWVCWVHMEAACLRKLEAMALLQLRSLRREWPSARVSASPHLPSSGDIVEWVAPFGQSPETLNDCLC